MVHGMLELHGECDQPHTLRSRPAPKPLDGVHASSQDCKRTFPEGTIREQSHSIRTCHCMSLDILERELNSSA